MLGTVTKVVWSSKIKICPASQAVQGWKQKYANAAKKSEVKPMEVRGSMLYKGVKKTDLPVEYYSQPKAWMTGDII